LHGEQWNAESGMEGLGHAVTVVGYTLTQGAVTHLVVHDNRPLTVRNARMPVGARLVAITTVVPEPGTFLALGLGLALLEARRRIADSRSAKRMRTKLSR
jgi:hypothetical protein